MRFIELFEGVAIKNLHHLAAYAITVAEAYDAAALHDPAANSSWEALNKHNSEVLFKHLQGSINVEFSADDPYSVEGESADMAVRRMLYDMLVNKRLKIYTGFSDNHPFFSEQENVILRTVHDYYTHAKLLRPFKAGLEQLGHKGQQVTDSELKKLLPRVDLSKHGNIGHAFTLRGEYNSYSTHTKLAPAAAVPALFTEIAGQVSYFSVAQGFPAQKVAILSGFDYKTIGKCAAGSQQDTRMNEILQILGQGASEIETHVQAAPTLDVKAYMAEISRR